MMRGLVLVLVTLPLPALADSLVATRTIRAQTVIAADAVALVEADIPGALSEPAEAVGLEAKVTLYAGRPLRPEDLGPAAVVKRNQGVTLIYSVGGLRILTDGRALERGAAGDVIQVMNLASHATIFGTVGADGSIQVGPSSKG